MKKILQGYFYSPTKGNLNINRVVNEMIDFIQAKPDNFYDVIVGCDSSSGINPSFPVAIVILRKGEGGRFFLKKVNYSSKENKKFHSWKVRILQEVLLSCELALCLKEKLEKKIRGLSSSLDYQFRYIHADIGENGQTRDMIKEVVGLIRGNGFEPQIKPRSYVATSVADRYT